MQNTDVNWMFMGSSQTSFFCRSCSCWWCWLLPACIRSFKWKVPGCWLSVTITVCRSGSLKKQKNSVSQKQQSYKVTLIMIMYIFLLLHHLYLELLISPGEAVSISGQSCLNMSQYLWVLNWVGQTIVLHCT